MAKIIIEVKGYGKVKVKKPDLTEEAVLDAIAETVAKTCQLVIPTSKKDKRFHPVLGIGGYADGSRAILSSKRGRQEPS